MEIHTLSDAERYLDGFINRERVADFDYEKLGLARIRGRRSRGPVRDVRPE